MNEIANLGRFRQIILPIEGISCASCVTRIESNLSELKGVKSVSVNLATGSAAISYDDALTSIDLIGKSIEEIGYKAVIADEDNFLHLREKLDKRELTSLRIDLVLSLILTLPVTVLNMFFSHRFFWINYILFVLTLPVLVWSGRRFFIGFWKMLKHFSADMNSLVAVGTSVSFIFSALVSFFPELVMATGGHPATYYDTAAVIVTLILLGRYLEFKAKGNASLSIRKLLNLQSRSARVVRNGVEIEIPAAQVAVGDILLVKPGDRIPVDGVVTGGSSFADESMITGESSPVEKVIGSEVIGATINQSGSFTFQAKKIGKDTVLAQIVKLVEEAQGSKAPIQHLADKVSSIFVPTVISFSILTFFLRYLFGPEGGLIDAMLSSVAVLVVACPCALGLATPAAIIVGTGIGAEHGIIIKNARFLEAADKLDTVIFDKTGTITKGKPVLKEAIPFPTFTARELIYNAAMVEKYSEHPIGRAIIDHALELEIKLGTPLHFDSIPGMGSEALVDKRVVKIGNYKYLEPVIKLSDEALSLAGRLETLGETVVYVSISGRLAGIISVSDKVKESSKQTVESLKKAGLSVWMITGDNARTAKSVAAEVGIENYIPGLLPAQKVREIKKLQSEGRKVAMVGDGINDSPALAQADIGIAIGTGTDIANETGDIVLVNGDLRGMMVAIELSVKTMKTIRQNLFWAFAYNIILIPLAASGNLDPMLAAGAMAMSSVSVVGNSLRLKRLKFQGGPLWTLPGQASPGPEGGG